MATRLYVRAMIKLWVNFLVSHHQFVPGVIPKHTPCLINGVEVGNNTTLFKKRQPSLIAAVSL